MNLGRLLGLGAGYGVGFMLVKSLFPQPFILLIAQGNSGSEGNLTLISLTYMAAGLVAGLVAAPLFGAFLLSREGPGEEQDVQMPRLVVGFGLSLILAALMAVISASLTLAAYATGLLPTGGVLDPTRLIGSSNHPEPGIPLLVAWTIARDLLPAILTGLFLAPVGGNVLLRLYSRRQTSGVGHQEGWQ